MSTSMGFGGDVRDRPLETRLGGVARADDDSEGGARSCSFGGGVGGFFGESESSWAIVADFGPLDVFLPTTVRFEFPRPAVMVVVMLMGREKPRSAAVMSSPLDMCLP